MLAAANEPSAQALPSPPRPVIERPGEVHLHFHGVDAAEVAAILCQHGDTAGCPAGRVHPELQPGKGCTRCRWV